MHNNMVSICVAGGHIHFKFACYTGIHFKRCLSAEYFSVHLSVRKI
jgi:hypothetical protein